MSTRCQVKVTDGAESVTLYHHTDGYPSHMLPLIKSAWEKYGQGWEGARAGKVASMLCAVDPTVFEPEEGHTLHADIEFYYVIDCKDTAHVGTKPVWTVGAFSADFDFPEFDAKTREYKKGWKPKKDKDRLHELAQVPVNEITKKYADELETNVNETY